jgi:hypothetical protein
MGQDSAESVSLHNLVHHTSAGDATKKTPEAHHFRRSKIDRQPDRKET